MRNPSFNRDRAICDRRDTHRDVKRWPLAAIFAENLRQVGRTDADLLGKVRPRYFRVLDILCELFHARTLANS